MVTDGNYSPQPNNCLQTMAQDNPHIYIDIAFSKYVALVVVVNTYDEELCKSSVYSILYAILLVFIKAAVMSPKHAFKSKVRSPDHSFRK